MGGERAEVREGERPSLCTQLLTAGAAAFRDTAVSISPLQTRGNLLGPTKYGTRSQTEPTNQS